MELLEKLGQYLIWADEAIWNLVKNLTDEEFAQSSGGGMRSIRARYVHLALDIYQWYNDWTGESPEDEPDFENMPRDELFESIAVYERKLVDLIKNRAFDALELDADGNKIRVVFSEFLFHMVNHSTYHRGQIVASLRGLGKKVLMTDYVPFRIATA
ncbi:MAG: DinB family protein [Candidatus Thorarchaeota archaeon]